VLVVIWDFGLMAARKSAVVEGNSTYGGTIISCQVAIA